jgi:glycosyltransferase involved in cell wall biosynthesis
MDNIVFSCIIPASKKDAESQNLKDLISSIKDQDFPQDQIEILVITEGDSESAKAIGIRQAKGEICAMFCADNYITSPYLFRNVKNRMIGEVACYDRRYAYKREDNSINRYFSLMGNNDPIAFYLGKCDREPWVDGIYKRHGIPSYGCNGFFVKRSSFNNTDLNHYYPMDAHVDMLENGLKYDVIEESRIWHRTSDNLISFLKKRYRYARDLYCDRKDRRWKMVDTFQDELRLAGFVISTLLVLPTLAVSIRGFIRIKDWAWFYHPLVCFGFLVTYSILAFRNLFKHGRLFQCSPA